MENPFLKKDFPPDWESMRPEFAADAVRAAIEVAKQNFASIRSAGTPTYENTIRAFDRAAMDLDRVWTYLNHLQSVADNSELRNALNDLIPEVSGFYSSILLDDTLYARIKEFSQSPAARDISGYRKRLLEETLLDFELEGAKLPPDKKKRLAEIETILSSKTQKFSENVLDSTKEFELRISDAADLKGLPPNAIAVAKKKAESEGFGGWIFTLEQPSYVPFISYADSESLREKMWKAYSKIASCGKFSNLSLIGEILALRDEQAKILGNPDFADFVLRRRMAKSGKKALKFIEDLRDKFYPFFKSEWEAMLRFARQNGLLKGEYVDPWSSAYIAEKFRLSEYGFDPEELRPYFPLDSVLRGVFEVSERLYGIKIEECKLAKPAWHADVKLFKMTSPDGKLMGLFYADLFPRKEKRAGAWMNMLSPSDGKFPALGLIAGNFSEPAGEIPALLSFDDVCTLFHEFGHLVHFFMMDCPEIGLRDVAWDFVELPSQIMENWCEKRECLDIFARHWKTGEKIPGALFEKFKASRKFMGANSAMRQLSFAALDLRLHIDPQKFANSKDIEEQAQKLLSGYSHKYSQTPPTILPRFTHIFGDSVGYAAGYYSYKWAEALDADAFTRFESEGLFNGETGRDFAEKILKVGNTIDPGTAFESFMGRPPCIDALVKRTLAE